MLGNFQKCLTVTLGFEGGWSDHPKDPGGATMKGVTLKLFRRFFPAATKADLRKISDSQVAQIYSTEFWRAINADRLAAGVDLATFDAAVNSGPARALKWLLAAAGGPDDETVKKLCRLRLGFMQSLNIWNTFKNGWSKRVAAIEAKGVAWALQAQGTISATKQALAKEQTAAASAANKQKAGAQTTGTVTVAGGGDVTINPEHADQIGAWLVGGMLLVGAAVAAVLVIRHVVHKHRAAAYAAELNAITPDMVGN